MAPPTPNDLNSEPTTNPLGSTAKAGAITSLLGNFTSPAVRPWLLLGGWSVLVYVLFRTWNVLFARYVAATGYNGDIFRETMRGGFAPLYVHTQVPTIPLLLSLWAVLVVVFYWQGERGLTRKYFGWFVAFAQMLLIFAFGMTDGTERAFGMYAHYTNFAIGLPFAGESIESFFGGYTDLMQRPNLGAHLNHYPPGNLLLLWLAQSAGHINAAKWVVVLASVATLWQIARIGRTLGWERSATNWAQLLFATSSVTLIFPTLDLVAIPTFLAAWSMAAYFRMLQYFANSVNEHSLRASLELMLALTLFTLFSFNVLVVLAWMVLGVWVFLFRLRKGFNVSFVVNILEWLLIGIIILTGVAVVYGALYWWTGFDILTCFQQAVQNNATQMNYSAADNIASPARYLFRSTGNILAYSIAAGAWVVFLALFGSRRSERRGAGLLTGVLYGTTFAVLVAAGFSTLFLGETERVWGFFTPCLAALAGFGMRAWMRRYGWRTAFVTFALLFLASIAFEAYLSHVC